MTARDIRMDEILAMWARMGLLAGKDLDAVRKELQGLGEAVMPTDEPGFTAGEIAQSCGCAQCTITRRLARLIREGRCVKGWAKRGVRRVPVYRMVNGDDGANDGPQNNDPHDSKASAGS